MSCGNCGRQNPSSALYCLDCGQQLRDPGPLPPAVQGVRDVVAGGPLIPETHEQRLPPMQPVEACARCGVDNPPGMRFCRMCGGPMAREAAPPAPAGIPAHLTNCPRCRAPLDPGGAFCGVCGLPATDMFPAVAAAPQAQLAPPPGAAVPASAPTPAMAPVFAPPPVAAVPQAQLAPPVVLSAVAPGVDLAAPVARPELRTDNYGAEPGASPARLVTILRDGSEGPSYRVSEATTDIGRSEGTITLPDDPYLSPRHARIAFRGAKFFLRDLGSVNGIFYRLREPVMLHHGDVVLAGQQVLRLEVLQDAEVSLGPVMHYGVMLFGTPEQSRFARLVQMTTEGVPRDVYHLHRDETVVGRELGDIVFTDDAFLSRRHVAFKIDRAQRQVSIRDLGSSNGTLVQFRGEREMTDGDLFRIGHHLFRFDLSSRPAGGGGSGGPASR